jgi:hypothetical protein
MVKLATARKPLIALRQTEYTITELDMTVTVAEMVRKIFKGDPLTLFERLIFIAALTNAGDYMPAQKAARRGAKGDVNTETAFVLARLLIADDPKMSKKDAIEYARRATIGILAKQRMSNDAALVEKTAIEWATKDVDDSGLVENVTRRIKLKKIRAAVKVLNDSTKKEDCF